ncbi:hypothetical protein HORIV_26940 [Vreelandella olivaria]|uniref:Uncharacterized protein n=1 Tax=Vreelandella olivaria TaxID=390919 RepID=A0ABN5WTM3_9GAMM|nr:hypothetical protein HORIV_26940 [Halomonas olivaria]
MVKGLLRPALNTTCSGEAWRTNWMPELVPLPWCPATKNTNGQVYLTQKAPLHLGAHIPRNQQSLLTNAHLKNAGAIVSRQVVISLRGAREYGS